MARMVKCVKLQRELPGLEFKPFPNDLGQRIYESVSQEAWKMWLEHFKMIMNEYRLAGGSEQANQILFDQAEKYFFGEGAALPPDYKPPQAKGEGAGRRRHPRRLLLRARAAAGGGGARARPASAGGGS